MFITFMVDTAAKSSRYQTFRFRPFPLDPAGELLISKDNVIYKSYISAEFPAERVQYTNIRVLYTNITD